MYYITKICVLCLSTDDLIEVDNEMYKDYLHIFPEINVNIVEIPLHICCSCEVALEAFYIFRKKCLKSFTRWEGYIKNLQDATNYKTLGKIYIDIGSNRKRNNSNLTISNTNTQICEPQEKKLRINDEISNNNPLFVEKSEDEKQNHANMAEQEKMGLEDTHDKNVKYKSQNRAQEICYWFRYLPTIDSKKLAPKNQKSTTQYSKENEINPNSPHDTTLEIIPTDLQSKTQNNIPTNNAQNQPPTAQNLSSNTNNHKAIQTTITRLPTTQNKSSTTAQTSTETTIFPVTTQSCTQNDTNAEKNQPAQNSATILPIPQQNAQKVILLLPIPQKGTKTESAQNQGISVQQSTAQKNAQTPKKKDLPSETQKTILLPPTTLKCTQIESAQNQKTIVQQPTTQNDSQTSKQNDLPSETTKSSQNAEKTILFPPPAIKCTQTTTILRGKIAQNSRPSLTTVPIDSLVFHRLTTPKNEAQTSKQNDLLSETTQSCSQNAQETILLPPMAQKCTQTESAQNQETFVQEPTAQNDAHTSKQKDIASETTLTENAQKIDVPFKTTILRAKVPQDSLPSLTTVPIDSLVFHRPTTPQIEAQNSQGDQSTTLAQNLQNDEKKFEKLPIIQVIKCQICGGYVNNISQFQKHFSSHFKSTVAEYNKNTETILKCPFCKKVVENLKNLQDHYRKHIKTAYNNYHLLKQCDPFVYRKGLENLNQGEQELMQFLTFNCLPGLKPGFKCKICNETIEGEPGERCNIDKHVIKHIGDSVNFCRLCHKKFDADFLKFHIETVHMGPQGPLICKKCGKQFFELSQLQMHVLLYFPTELFGCKLCTFSAKDIQSTKIHILQHLTQNKCVRPPKLSLNLHKKFENNLVQNGLILKKNYYDNLICVMCGFTGANNNQLCSHYEIHRQSNSKLFKCSTCKFSFSDAKTFHIHKKSHSSTLQIMGKRSIHKTYSKAIPEVKVNIIKEINEQPQNVSVIDNEYLNILTKI